ncbi:MAG: hypothetical protein EOR77_25765 [Mesorhizobium sp.]|uniref:hypothetical protein n=1 Tax=Mesorhizobium sp. TaxID=1871066 RepID=UPI000FE9158C|nr:hypothetical protein [Mesorhizobium sp.]RWH88001.1 MAG: hypothetical protein EOQ87_23255 [Mesorhizobium sp.]RWM30236.1 MAG: hypothetical protein EOR77_25765 [Mesorhizobium sp.]TJV32049.1 MAG: hypothetical protein E5X87_21385 [Mesorhizobium sp.]
MMKNSAASVDMGFVTSKNRPLSRNAQGKRSGPVEDVIAWAWRDELPKVPRRQDGPMRMAGGWDRAGRFAELLSLVDLFGVNQFGAVPDFSADSWPCQDAQLIGGAVMALDDYALDLPEDWRPAPELDRFAGLGAKALSEAWRRMTHDDGQGRVTLRLKPSELIIRRAVMGWDAEGMKLDDTSQEIERHANGKPRYYLQMAQHQLTGTVIDGQDETVTRLIEVSGVNKKGEALPGAYTKPYLDPDPVNAIIARAEHEIWLSALATVFDAVAGQMQDVVMLPSTIPVAPWLAPMPTQRVLPDLIGNAALLRQQQDRADALLAARFPRWFRLFNKKSEAPA